jgi:ABC-type uncharacterized transport system substrate-binding protein
MAKVEIPDNSAWLRYFKRLSQLAVDHPHITRETRIELNGGQKGVQAVIEIRSFTPDE